MIELFTIDRTGLSLAIIYSNVQIVKYLTDMFDYDPRDMTYYFTNAVINGDLEIIKDLADV